MKFGYGCRSITPGPYSRLTLSGFIARRNKPLRGIDDPIYVHALCMELRGETILHLVFDLLALGEEACTVLDAVLDSYGISRKNRVYAATHTHSAPAAITLHGSGVVDRTYIEFLAEQASKAVSVALGSMKKGKLRHALIDLEGCNTNRRFLEEHGHIVMEPSEKTSAPQGPNYRPLNLFLCEDKNGKAQFGIAHWAAHPNIIWSMRVSAEFPGELRNRLGDKFGCPFLYLQGSSGNINPVHKGRSRASMLKSVDEVIAKLPAEIKWNDVMPSSHDRFVSYKEILRYKKIPEKTELKKEFIRMSEVETNGLDSDPSALTEIATILGLDPGMVPVHKYRYVAGVLKEWARTNMVSQNLKQEIEINISLLELGDFVFCFVPGEVFVESQIKLSKLLPEKKVIVVGYAAPLFGYLPTREAASKGGYEAVLAYKFYGHPAAFEDNAEPLLVKGILQKIREDQFE